MVSFSCRELSLNRRQKPWQMNWATVSTFIASGAGRLLSAASMVRNKESKSHFPIPLSSLRLRHCLDDPHFRFFSWLRNTRIRSLANCKYRSGRRRTKMKQAAILQLANAYPFKQGAMMLVFWTIHVVLARLFLSSGRLITPISSPHH